MYSTYCTVQYLCRSECAGIPIANPTFTRLQTWGMMSIWLMIASDVSSIRLRVVRAKEKPVAAKNETAWNCYLLQLTNRTARSPFHASRVCGVADAPWLLLCNGPEEYVLPSYGNTPRSRLHANRPRKWHKGDNVVFGALLQCALLYALAGWQEL
jgi:hypothetical protein